MQQPWVRHTQRVQRQQALAQLLRRSRCLLLLLRGLLLLLAAARAGGHRVRVGGVAVHVAVGVGVAAGGCGARSCCRRHALQLQHAGQQSVHHLNRARSYGIVLRLAVLHGDSPYGRRYGAV